MDYYIGDPVSTPVEEMGPYFSEKLILMPWTYQITEHKNEYSNDFKELLPKDEAPIIFANFNQPVKV